MKRPIPRKGKKLRAHPIHKHLPYPSDVEFPESNKPGAPLIPRLYSYHNDKSMRCSIENVCCDCGLTHLITFEVFKASDGNWYLAKRSYRASLATEAERKIRKYAFREVRRKSGKV